MSWMRFFVPPCMLFFAVLSAPFFGACQNKKCHAELCQGCCSNEGLCLEGNTLEACGIQGETCMRCSGGQSCSWGVCLGANPNPNPGSSGGGDGEKGGTPPTSALWWLEGDFTLHRSFPELSQQTPFHFSSPVVFWDASPHGKRWAVMLATSKTQYEVLQTSDDQTRSLHTGLGVPQKIAFAQDSRGLAFLIGDENNRGHLFGSLHANDSPQKLSFEKCGLQDSSVNVLDFAWSPDSSGVAALARVGDDLRAGIWLLTTTEPGACTTVVHPETAMEASAEWGAFGPLRWMDKDTLYFRASLTYNHPLQLYSFGLNGTGGLLNPVLSPYTSSVRDFALHPSLSMLALLQENFSLSLLSFSPPTTLLPDAHCEIQNSKALLFSPKNDWLAVVGNARSQLLNLGNMQCSLSATLAVSEALWSPDGNFLAEVSCANSADCSIVLSKNDGQNLLNPTVVSEGFQHLHALKWTAY